MSEFTAAPNGSGLGRSIHDAPDLSASEIEDMRVEEIMAKVTRRDLERALAILMNAVLEAEGQAVELELATQGVLSKKLTDSLEQITASLIGDGMDRVTEILPEGAVEILQEMS
jgi:hypothetical protein